MFLIICRISVLLLVFLFPREAEMQALPNITAAPSSPLHVLKGQNVTLTWMYNLNGDNFQTTFDDGATTIVVRRLTQATSFPSAAYANRVSANVTDTSAVITLHTVDSSDSKIYKFKIFNSVSLQDTSSTVELIVQVPPSFKSFSPDHVVVESAADITLNCDAAGVPSPNVTWTKVFPNGSDSDVLFTDTEPPYDYAISNNRNEAGTYRCKADNGIGNAINQTINVTINFKPENVQLIVNDSNVCLDDVISISCSADGNPMIHTYQLYENDVLVSNNSSPIVWSKSASTGGVFVYRCVANNTVGTANSTTTVTVNVPPAIEQLSNITVTEGENSNLTCNVTGSPVLTVSWTAVASGNRTEGNIRQLTNISRNEDGEYKCDASNLCGNDSKSTHLIVQFKPENVQLTVNDSNICQGDVISVSCSADGNPAVHTYQLFQNDTLVSNSSSPIVWRKSASTGGVFVYRCEANNTVGTASSTKTITVYVPSSIQAIPDKNITEGDNLTLTCQAFGTPPLTVSWIKVSSGQPTNGHVLELTNINRSDAGDYRCEASNECGNSSELVNINVQYKPENVQLTANATNKVCRNDIVKFNCSADANPPVMSYQLFKNDTALETISSGMWSKTLSSSGLFIYHCVANNTIGTASSTSVSITVNEPSSILSILDRNITEGDNLTLTCQAFGTPPLTVSWIKVSSGQLTNGHMLELTNINRSEAGDYRCEASNECGNSSELVNINVQYKPENVRFETTATGNKACQNDIVKFNCSAGAVPPVTSYQLLENGIALETTNSGMWSKTLSSSGSFTYKCVANNSVGSASSTSVVIIVGVASSIQQIQNETITEGGNVTVFCNASGTPPPAVSWIKVIGGQRSDENMLKLAYISRSQAGEYKCEASNECGNSSETVNINVQYPPNITDISDTQTLNVGATVTLNCTADGNPTASITWTKVSDGSVVPFPLTITGKQDEGAYRCTADNGVGSNITEDVSIIVHFPASIVPLEETKRVTKGGSITLFCNVSGQPVPSVTWTHNDTGKRVNNKTWVIDNIGESDLGKYQCDASNMYGNATDTTEILFEGGRCEKTCSSGQDCLPIGSFYSCRCKKGKKGTNCEKTEAPKKVIEVRIRFKNEEYKEEYNNLADPVTVKFVKYIEGNCTEEYKAKSKGLKFEKCKVTKLSRGSVIADMELQFKEGVSESQIRVLTQKITEDGSLGQLEVDSVIVGPTPPPPEVEEKCNAFFEGKDCKKAKPALIALCVVAGVVVLALLVAIIACSLHKKKRGGQTFSNGEYGQPRHEPEGHGGTGERNAANGVRMSGGNHYDNTAYEQEMQPPTPMVTFTNPSQTPGITVNDSSVTK